ncbi:MAG TPA: hypothetical protein VMW49_07690, partial [Candidatus Dormibacteraeota bacterium]|nr:hypothetical protein [Candidatus Dormibacteraeota bacterium]
AADLTTLAQRRADLGRAGEQERQLAEARSRLEAEAALEAEAWRRLWAPVGVEARAPEEMTAWREGHLELVAALAQLAARRHALLAEEEAVALAAEGLQAALSVLGQAPDSTHLEPLAAQAREIVDGERRQVEARRQVDRDWKLALAGRPDRERAVAQLSSELDGWQAAWARALAPLGLAAELRPRAARQAVRAHRDLPAARQEVAGLEGRIRGIERDLAAFRDQVGAGAAGLEETGDRSPLDVVDALHRRLTAARAAESRRATLAGQLEEVAQAVAATGSAATRGEEELARLRVEAGLSPDTPLPPVVERSRAAAVGRERLGQVDQDLLALGAGRSPEEIRAEVAEIGLDGDQLAAALATLAEEVEAQEGALGQAQLALGQARTELRAVTDAGTAADREQDAQAELARAAAGAGEYARTAIAAAVLREVIAEYGERHRGPMLDRAGALFARLTVGAFTELIPEGLGDRPILLAKRRNGELRTTAELSDGARDQLYLALRLAGIEYQLEHLPEPLPVVFDDVLVNFDDERAAAALAVLAELGRRTQVLLFTHHQGVVESAREALPADRLLVLRVPGRDHGQPVVAAGGVGEAAVGAPVPRGGGDRTVACVLEALRLAGRPLAKAELVPMAKIDEARWPPAIRRLLDSGAVVQEGRKRGARYRLPR